MSSPFYCLIDCLFVCLWPFKFHLFMKTFSVLGTGTSWKEYSCQQKETNFILLNRQVSQKKLQPSSCTKIQMDRPHRDLLLHRCILPESGQLRGTIFLSSWYNPQWKSLLLGNPVLPSAFAPEQPDSARPHSDRYVNIQLTVMLTSSGCKSLP